MPRQADIERECYNLLLGPDLAISKLHQLYFVLISLWTSFAVSKAFTNLVYIIYDIIRFRYIHHALQAQQPRALFERRGPRPGSRALHQEGASKHLPRCF